MPGNSRVIYVATKALLLNDNNELLILKQSDPTITGHNMFHPPGGILEFGESMHQCLEREVLEETGLKIRINRLFEIGEWTASRESLDMQFVGMYYDCNLLGGEIALQSSEAHGFAWIAHKDIDSYDILEPSRSIIKKFLIQLDN